MFRKTGLILRPLLMLSLLFAAGYRPGATTPSTVQAQPSSPTAASMRLSADLADALQVLPGDAQLRVIVRFDPTKHRQILSEQADKPLPERRAGRAMLVSRLQIAAEQSQSGVRAFLAQPAIAANVRHVRPLWAINALALSATPDVVRALAARDDVQMVTLDRWQKWIADDVEPVAGPLVMRHPPTRSPLSTTLTARVQAAPPAPGEVTWGLARIGADRVWRELGVTGAGVTVANIDTGVDLHHPALKPRYRGWNGGPVADHLHNWFDATNESATYPSDLHGHGTHTMGSIVGEGGIGVAPGARWMAAKGLNGDGFGYYSWLHAAFQFMLAPNGDPSFAPDILSNSWGSNDGSDAEFLPDIRALHAAGIFVLFANGNSGPGAGTVGSPASLPGAIGIGASDPDDDIARFSGHGPSPFNEVRPHLVAPGVNVVSTYPGGGYARASGTSMATPHVAGVAALLHSVSPTLDITATLFALTSTAVPLSTTLPNNVSGWGRVDAYRAVLSVLPHGVITGQVLHAGQPISGATVVAHDGTHTPSTTTDAQGRYAIPAPPGIYTVTASAFGFTPATSAPRIVQVGQVVTVNFALTPLPSGIVRGIVTDVVSGAALTRTLVRALDTPAQSYADSGLGYYVLHLPAGTYTIEARLTGYLVQTRTVVVTDGGITEAPFALTPTQRILLVDSGAWYYASAADFYRRALADLRLAHDEMRIKQIPRDAPTITDLLRYDTVIWSAPFDSPGIVGAGDAISRYLAAGRNLLLSGQDVAFYDGYFGMRAYFNRLNALFLDDSAPSRQVIGLPGTLLAGRAFSIAGGEGANNQVLPDVVGLRNADFGLPIARYDGESRSNAWAGVYAAPCLPYRSAFFSFGVEAIHSAAERAAVLGQTLAAFAAPRPAQGVALAWQPDRHREIPVALPGRVITHVVRVRNTGEAGVTETLTLTLSGNRWPAQLSQATLTLGPCRAATVVITVSVPTTATWHATDAVTLTASLLSAPAVSSSLALPAKTPAGVLLVDDDRFFDREGDYLAALAAHGNVADRWSTLGGNWTESPPLDVLQMYPLVIWFNAYDWFDPLRDAEATRLLAYLDGGGRLFLSSQSALYYLTPGHPFVRARLGIGAIDDTDVTSAVFGAPGHVIGSGFPSSTLLTGPGGRFPYNWNLSTALQPGPGVSVALRGESAQPFGLANAGLAHGAIPTLHLSSWLTTTMWRTAFMPFAFEVLDASARADLMNRVVGWLSWLGESELRAHVPDAAPGQPITFTLYAKLDEARSGAVTARVHLSATVSDAGFVAASDLAGASGHFAGAWQGAMSSGQVLSWTFVVTTPATLPPGTPLTATAFFALEEPGLRFARQAVIRLGAPQLAATLHLTPSPSRWGERITATAWLTNLGPAAAPSATLLAVVPSGLRLLTATVAASRPGLSHAPPNTVRWVGGLAAGESVSVTYAMTVPTFTYWPGAYYHAVLFGADSPLQRQIDAWIVPWTARRYVPIVRRAP